MRQIVLDTETTGLEVSDGHRIIEIGAVEIINRSLTGNVYHQYLNPERAIDEGAQEVHGISIESLQDKPKFHEISDDFIEFIRGGELIIHNAEFDIGFLEAELKLIDAPYQRLEGEVCAAVIDSLKMARKLHPGQRNNLDALCKRYMIDNTQRELHGALLDAQILSDVYLAMTGGQVSMSLSANAGASQTDQAQAGGSREQHDLPVTVVAADELQAHEEFLSYIAKHSNDETSVWQALAEAADQSGK
ncbi:DNA polymerase III subunit epsilon [Gammaproteobacteria bacterium]|nr:DNA polymerase III subunit epsilon [Gammaproteobacteria bacterium]